MVDQFFTDLAIQIFDDEEKIEPGRIGLVNAEDRNRETALHVLSRKFPLPSANDQNPGIKSKFTNVIIIYAYADMFMYVN